MNFKSKKGFLIGIFVWIISLLLLALAFVLLLQWDNEKWNAIIPILLPLFLLWIWFDTSYQIQNQLLKFRAGPIRFSIKIQDINTIVVGENLSFGFRPALSLNGCIIKYERWNEIYISPQNLDQFNEELIRINPKIVIV